MNPKSFAQRLRITFKLRDGILYWKYPPLAFKRRRWLIGRVAGHNHGGKWEIVFEGVKYHREDLIKAHWPNKYVKEPKVRVVKPRPYRRLPVN